MMDFMWGAIYYIGFILVCLCLIIVVVKIVWNLGLPYAMLREKARGWSIFPLIEIVPLFVAIAIAFLTQQHGVFSPLHLITWGLGAILVSYLHLAIVATVYGIIKWGYERNSSGQ